MNRPMALVLVSCATLVLAGQGRDLSTIDDLREAEVAREMFVSGEFVIPTLAGLPFLEKPSGFPVIVALAYRSTGGPSVVAARLVAAGFALAALASVFFLGMRMGGPPCAAASTVVLALSAMFVRTSHEILLDNALTASVGCAVMGAWCGLAAAENRRRLPWFAVAGASLGFAFLFKGFVGPSIFLAGIVPYLLLARRWKELRFLVHPVPILSFLAVAALWVIPFLLRSTPEQRYEFFVSNHLGRAASAYHSHEGPLWYYFETLTYRFAPGVLLLPLAAIGAWRGRKTAAGSAALYALCGAAGPMLLLSLLRAKDAVYLLPAYPAFSVLVGTWCSKTFAEPDRLARGALGTGAVLAVLVAGIAIGFTAAKEGVRVQSLASALGWSVGLGLLARAIRTRSVPGQSSLLGGFLALAGIQTVVGPISEIDMARHVPWRPGTRALMKAAEGRELFLYLPDDRLRGALGFYRNRTAIEVRDERDLTDRLQQDPKAWVVMAVHGRDLPRAVLEAAAARGIVLRETFRAPYFDAELVAFGVEGSAALTNTDSSHLADRP